MCMYPPSEKFKVGPTISSLFILVAQDAPLNGMPHLFGGFLKTRHLSAGNLPVAAAD